MSLACGCLPRFTDDATNVCLAAKRYARAEEAPSIGTRHLLAALLDQPWSEACGILRQLGQDPRELRMLIAVQPARSPQPLPPVPWSGDAKAAVHAALDHHTQWQHPYVDTTHMLVGLLAAGDTAACQLLHPRGVTRDRIARQLRAE